MGANMVTWQLKWEESMLWFYINPYLFVLLILQSWNHSFSPKLYIKLASSLRNGLPAETNSKVLILLNPRAKIKPDSFLKQLTRAFNTVLKITVSILIYIVYLLFCRCWKITAFHPNSTFSTNWAQKQVIAVYCLHDSGFKFNF